jgi:hypothetical protein
MCKQSSTSLSKKQHTRGKNTLSSCTDLLLDLKTVPPHTYLSGHFWHSQVAATNKREGIKNTLTSLHNSTSEETPSGWTLFLHWKKNRLGLEAQCGGIFAKYVQNKVRLQ